MDSKKTTEILDSKLRSIENEPDAWMHYFRQKGGGKSISYPSIDNPAFHPTEEGYDWLEARPLFEGAQPEKTSTLVRYKEKLLLQQMELSEEMHDVITGELDDIWKALTPDERSVADAFCRDLSKRGPLADKEFFEYLFQVLNYYADESIYQGNRIGGILEGCPRGPAPSPSDLTHTAEKAKALLRIHYVVHASSDSIPVPRTTLQWWRQLVDYNPRDLAPRMDRYLQDTPSKPVQTVSSIFTLDSGWQIPITFDIEKNTFVESAPPELHVKGPELKPGTPEYRLNYLLSELEKRFPKLHNPIMSDPVEPKYLEAIDALIADCKSRLSQQT